jgi:hypothetical protein
MSPMRRLRPATATRSVGHGATVSNSPVTRSGTACVADCTAPAGTTAFCACSCLAICLASSPSVASVCGESSMKMRSS